MKDLTNFATDEHPLHPSGIGALMVCPLRIAMQFLEPDGTDEGGPAGDTGSALHAAAAAFHRGKGVSDSLAAMTAGVAKYPQADLNDAANMFLSYSADPRNRDAKVLLVEAPIRFSILPSPEDRTQKNIEIEGTVDQVREEWGKACVLDIKSSKKSPMEQMSMYMFQQVGYVVGSSVALQRRVENAKLICTRQYAGKDPATANVFWTYPWTFDDAADILEGVRHMVAIVRNGNLFHVPNKDCQWCEQRSPDLCLPKLQKLRLRIRNVPDEAQVQGA